jgi:hypothetical protein
MRDTQAGRQKTNAPLIKPSRGDLTTDDAALPMRQLPPAEQVEFEMLLSV